MSKVYVINDSGHDYTPARPFGELVVLSEGTIDKFHLTQMLRAFESALPISSPEDYILISGPSIMNCVACAMFAAIHGCLNLLLFRMEPGGRPRYVARRINFKTKESKDEQET